MAITLNKIPEIYNPAYNECIFIVTSNQIAQTNFKYIADIYINGDVIRLTSPKHPVYSTGLFDFGRVVESYITSDISKSTYGFQQNLNSYVTWYVRFGEEYGTTPTSYPNLTTSFTQFSYNAIFDFLPYTNYTQVSYLLQQAAVKTILTNKPATVFIRDSEDAWLHAMTNTSGTIYDARVRTFDSSGGLIQTLKLVNPYQAVTSVNDRFIRFGCGTSNLNNFPSSGVILGSLPAITASVASYDVTFETYSGTLVSVPQVYTIDSNCTKNTSYRFHFLNKLGGFDSFTFYRGSTVTSAIQRSSFKSKTERQTSSSAYGYSASSRGQTEFDIKIKDNITVQSDWISEATNTWLEELITSPEVYLDDLTYGLVAVNILNPSYDFKQTVKEKLFNLTINFSYSYDRTRQRK